MYDDFAGSLHFSSIYRLVGEVLRLAKGRLPNSVTMDQALVKTNGIIRWTSEG